VVPVVGHDSDDIIGGGPHDHLANLEKLRNIADDSVELGTVVLEKGLWRK
jgi:hypothetical protein